MTERIDPRDHADRIVGEIARDALGAAADVEKRSAAVGHDELAEHLRDRVAGHAEARLLIDVLVVRQQARLETVDPDIEGRRSRLSKARHLQIDRLHRQDGRHRGRRRGGEADTRRVAAGGKPGTGDQVLETIDAGADDRNVVREHLLGLGEHLRLVSAMPYDASIDRLEELPVPLGKLDERGVLRLDAIQRRDESRAIGDQARHYPFGDARNVSPRTSNAARRPARIH